MATGQVLQEVVERWDKWVGSPDGVRTRRRWSSHRALAGWGPAELRMPRSSARTDAMQAALVSLAQGGDHDAAITLITQFRPGLGALARRIAATDPRFGSLDDATSEVVSVFGERIMAHRLDRRPTKIAANLLLDTRQRIWRAGTRDARIVEASLAAAATGPVASHHRPDAVAGELDVVAAVAAAIEQMPGTGTSRRVTAELAYRTWILEEPSAVVAHDLGLGREAASSRLYRLRAMVRCQLDDDRAGGDQLVTRRSPGLAPLSRPVGPSVASRQ